MVVLSGIEEGSSSSSPLDGYKYEYDVFLSLRGVDTRSSFSYHLYSALMRANITTFMDDEETYKNHEDLRLELVSAIRASRAYVIVLSYNYAYASSAWCLDELVLMLEQHMTSNRIVIPIYYHVQPSHVRKQKGSFEEAMTKHKHAMEVETDSNKRSQRAQKIDQWSKALTQVAELVGWDVEGWRETEFIDEIVKDISSRLHIPSRGALPQLIGMDYSIHMVTAWLKDASSHTTDILTILGSSGGIGKTSLAKYVYGSHHHEFGTSSFIENISRRCDEKFDGLLDLQKQLCDDISKPSPVQEHDVSIYTSKIENIVAHKKVFIVLDDIDSLKQLNPLLGRKGFHPESKIIITTKDAWLTESCELFKTNVKPKHTKHEIKGLHDAKIAAKIQSYTNNVHSLDPAGSDQALLSHP